jgi:hypothetical protein
VASTETKSKTNAAHIDATIESIEKHVKEESATGVSTAINTWIKTLEKHEELKGIAEGLEKLKDAIAEKNGKEIAETMTMLGSETTKAAESAEGNEATKIKHLGKALSTAAKAISKLVK